MESSSVCCLFTHLSSLQYWFASCCCEVPGCHFWSPEPSVYPQHNNSPCSCCWPSLSAIYVARAVRGWGPLRCPGPRGGSAPHPRQLRGAGGLIPIPGVTWPLQDGSEQQIWSTIPSPQHLAADGSSSSWLSPSIHPSIDPSLGEEERGGVEAAVTGKGLEKWQEMGQRKERFSQGKSQQQGWGERRMHSRGSEALQAPGGQGRKLLPRAELSSCCSLVFPALRASEAGN